MSDVILERFGLSTALLKDLAELGGKAAVALLAIGYMAGLLIINFNLRDYGTRSFGLLRADYVVAGLCWLGVTVVGWAALEILRLMMRTARAQFAARRRWAALIALLTGLATTGGLLVIATGFLSGQFVSSDSLRHVVLVIATILGQAVAVKFMSTAMRRAWRGQRYHLSDAADLPHNSIPLAVVGILWAVVAYTRFLYPDILPVLGGGRAEAVRLVLTDEGRASLLADRLEAGVVYVIVETDEWLLVSKAKPTVDHKTGARAAVRVRQEFVLALRSGP